ncbi:hypothetical protein M413DRAFT_13523 [Hebeloma cylindrosporum]|uniref:Uncharacterized protein n=1 Tax=Hebeloma cylindrosporum TaxID=76867 RepID=A0A0C2Y847_HEBCY|nr:hypothetical protein M413DRAFT_13523 [Hebeloma cylindrosporum h7]
MDSLIHRVCLFLTYYLCIQHSLDETITAWHLHKLQTAGNKTPLALYQLSKEKAIHRGYWTSDQGDPMDGVDSRYGVDEQKNFPPADELEQDPIEPNYDGFANMKRERDAGIFLNDDEEIKVAKACLEDFNEDDGILVLTYTMRLSLD